MRKFRWKKKRAAIYGTYQLPQEGSGDPNAGTNEINRCKDYCLQHDHHVLFTRVSFEGKREAAQQESMEFRRLLQAIEHDELDLVLFVDFAWISRKPEQVARLLSVAEAHQTTLIDVDRQHILFQPL